MPARAVKAPLPAGRNSMLLSSQVAGPADAVVLNRIGAPMKTGRGVHSTSGLSGAAAAPTAGTVKARRSTRLRVIGAGVWGIATGGRSIIPRGLAGQASEGRHGVRL